MKIKSDFILRDMGDMSIVVAVGESAQKFNGVINLNETAIFMWKELSKGCTRDALVESVLKEYDATRDVVERDVDNIIAKLKKENILDE